MGDNSGVTSPRLSTIVAALVAVGAGAWGLRQCSPDESLATRPKPSPELIAPPSGDSTRLAQTPTAAASTAALTTPQTLLAQAGRFRLAGVVAAVGNGGLALIAVDGKPAGTFRVGDAVDGEIVVRSVAVHTANLGLRDGSQTITLEMAPALAPMASPGPATAAATPAQTTSLPPVPSAPLANGSAQAQDTLRKLGSKHAPLLPPGPAAPPKPDDTTAAPADDGRWKPPGQQ